jgi:hypothetical protein
VAIPMLICDTEGDIVASNVSERKRIRENEKKIKIHIISHDKHREKGNLIDPDDDFQTCS